MSTNLLDLAGSALGSGAFGKIAGMLGESEQKTKSAYELAGSAILGGLIKKMSNPQGAKDVYEEVSRFDSGALANITQVLTGGGSEENTSAMSSLGSKLISGLLGSNQDSTIGMIAKLAGIGEGSSKSLLTMLAPLLLGMLSKQVKSGGLDLSGLTKLIMGQKEQVAKALPADFSRQLGIANLLDQGSQAVREGARQTRVAAEETASAGAGLLKVLVPLAIVAGLGFLIWKMTSSKAVDQVAQTTAEVASSAADATRDAASSVATSVAGAADRVTVNKPAIPGVNFDAISKELGSAFGTLTNSVADIKDEASAQAAVPQFEALTKQIETFGFDKMPEEANATLQVLIRPLIEKLQAALETVSKIPGVEAILEPAVKQLMSSVSAYTRS